MMQQVKQQRHKKLQEKTERHFSSETDTSQRDLVHLRTRKHEKNTLLSSTVLNYH